MAEPKAYKTKLSDFKPDPHNLNRHKQRGRGMVENSQRQRGFGRPGFAAKDKTMLGGNLSIMEVAADIELGNGEIFVVETDGDIPIVHLRRDLDPDTEAAKLLAAEDNQSALVSIDWDPEQFAKEIAAGVDFGGIFTADEQAALKAGLNDTPPEDTGPQIDKAEELLTKWKCEPGQIWQIESKANPGHYHRLICGDCRDKATIEALTQGKPVNGVFTSPPYAMQRAKQYGGVPTDEYVEWWEAVQDNMRAILADDGSFFVNIKPHCEDGQRVLYVFDLVLAMVRRWGWRFVDELCWERPGVPGRWSNRHRNSFEPCYHFSINGNIKFHPENNGYKSDNIMLSSKSVGADNDTNNGKYWNRNGNVKSGIALPDNVLNISNSDTGNTQAATFPLKLPTFFIRAYSDPLDIWLDPFAGSGTVGIATENEARLSLMVEQLPKYCAVILERFQTTFGIEPELASNA